MRKKLTKEDILNNELLSPQEQYKKYVKTDEWKQIHGHKEFQNKACPCYDVQKEFGDYNKMVLATYYDDGEGECD